MDSESQRISSARSTRPRHLKLFIRRAAMICRRWERITRWKTNDHFWEAILVLKMKKNNVAPIVQHIHCIETVSKFRSALVESHNCDIRLCWTSNSLGVP